MNAYFVMCYPTTGYIIENQGGFSSPRCPVFLETPVKICSFKKSGSNLQIVEQRACHIHIRHLRDPIVHLNVDIRVYKRTEK